MDQSYNAVEARIKEAIDALRTRQKFSRRAIATEFNVPEERLRSRLNGHPPKSEVRGLHNRALTTDQDLALRLYLQKLDQMGAPARLHMIQQTANKILRQDDKTPPERPPLDSQWAKRWLKRQPGLFKVRRKPLAAGRKNAHDLELLGAHLNRYEEICNKYGIQPSDRWNFDETGFRVGMGRNDWIVTMDPERRAYSKNPENRQSLSVVECINGAGQDIPPMLIIAGVNILAPWFNNDLAGDILLTVSDSGYADDWISLQWIKHFDKFSARRQQGVWRLLLMDGYGSHHTKEFLEYCEEKRIIPLALPSHTTHLLQPLDVCVFQPLKHWHAEAVNDAVQMGDETFTKLEFLNAFNSFRKRAFKRSTIETAWRLTGLIPYKPAIVLDKVREMLPPPRPTTPPPAPFEPLKQTPHTVRQIAESATELLCYEDIPDELSQKIMRFTKGACASARKGELMEERFDQQAQAEKARRARKAESNRVLSTGGVLYAKDARSMTRDRLEKEKRRQAEREKAWDKRYSTAVSKAVKGTIKHRRQLEYRANGMRKRWKSVL